MSPSNLQFTQKIGRNFSRLIITSGRLPSIFTVIGFFAFLQSRAALDFHAFSRQVISCRPQTSQHSTTTNAWALQPISAIAQCFCLNDVSQLCTNDISKLAFLRSSFSKRTFQPCVRTYQESAGIWNILQMQKLLVSYSAEFLCKSLGWVESSRLCKARYLFRPQSITNYSCMFKHFSTPCALDLFALLP